MDLRGSIRFIKKHVLDLLYPPFCLLCDDVLAHGTEEHLCDECQKAYPVLGGELCVICGKPLVDREQERCHDCRKRLHYFEEGRALWVYEGLVKDSIKAFKYAGRIEMANIFAKALSRYYNEHITWEIDLVIPVPLHRSRFKERGFSQTNLLAKSFCGYTDLTFDGKSLARVKATVAQEGLSDKDRIANVLHAFDVRGRDIYGQTVLLLDDVYTTGATLDGCAKVLMEAGAKKIYFMTVAIGRGY